MQRTIITAILVTVLLGSAILLGLNPVSVSGLAERLALEASSAPADAAAVGNFVNEASGGNLRLAVSETGHFYDADIEVAITASLPDAAIYYTTDGSEPTSASEQYTDPLPFTASSGMQAVVLKAIAVKGDTISRPFVHTYFLGWDVDTRFDTLVFSLSTDPAHLYDYDTGIFVEGRLRDEYKEQNPGARIEPPTPANFNIRGMEGERPIYVETFEPDGTRVVAQAAGVRVSGGWSRAETQKSLRLIARNEYESGYGKFHYEFFPGESLCDGYGTPLGKYDSIVLRNGANDRNEAMLRNEVASVMARDAGFREATPVRPCAVFLNGEYYGFSWIQVSLNEQYLQDIYGAPTKEFDIVGNGETWIVTDNIPAASALETLNGYADKDLTEDAVFAELEKILDLDNFLWYYAYEIYMGNDDWPNNNLKRWRYIGEPYEGMASELDGRWRYLLFDMDWTLGLYGDSPTKRTFQSVLGGSKKSPLLMAVLKRKDMADKFTMMLCDIMSGLVTTKNVSRVIETLYDESVYEIGQAINAHKYGFFVSDSSVAQHHDSMIAYAGRRGAYILSSLTTYFGYGEDMYTVEVSGGQARIGTLSCEASRYFNELTVPVSPVLGQYEVFDHWVLNGRRVDEPEIIVSANDAVDGTVKLELVTREERPALVISEVYTGKRNGCVLTNTTDQPVSTAGLYMSDTADNPLRWELPAATVPAGGTIVLAGKGSSDAKDLLKIQMGFNIKAGEVVTLADGDGVVLDYVVVGY